MPRRETQRLSAAEEPTESHTRVLAIALLCPKPAHPGGEALGLRPRHVPLLGRRWAPASRRRCGRTHNTLTRRERAVPGRITEEVSGTR